MTDRSVSVRFKADIADYVAKTRQMARETAAFGGQLAKAAQADKLDKLSQGATVAGAALVGAFGLAVKSAAEFESAMSGVSAATGANGAALRDLRDAAVQAGAATQYSATEAADAETELAKAGVRVGDILGGGLQGALSLAAAGQISVADAAETAATAMNQFGLSGSQVPHVADLLAAGAGKASGSVDDLSQALNQAGLVANQAGWSIDQTTGVLAEFANAGLQGSDAGTSLKTMLLSLEAPSSTAAAAMRRYGIEAYDAAGKLKSPIEIAKTLRGALGDVSDQERNAALSAIFGSDAIRAASILYKDGAAGAKKWADSVDDAGYASDQAAKLTNNLSGDLERLKGSLETALIESGSGATGALRGMAQAANAAIDQFSNLPAPLQSAAVWTSGIGGSALLAAGAFGSLWPKLQLAREQLAALGPVGEKVNGILGKTAGAVGRVGLALAATQAFSAVAGDTIQPVSGLSKALAEYGRTGHVAGAATGILGANLDKFRYDVSTFGTGALSKLGNGVASVAESLTGLGAVFDESLYHAQQRMQQTDQALAALVQGGHADQARAAFERLLKVTKQEGGNINDLKNALPQYETAIGNLTTTQGQAESSARAHALAEQTLKGSLEAAVNAAGSLEEALDQLNAGNISAEQAAIKVAEAEDNVSASFDRNGRTLDINTDKGRTNMGAILDLADAAIKAAQAKYQETGSLDKANQVYNSYISQLRRTLTQAGLTRSEINSLINKYFQIPKARKTNVSAPGAKGAKSDVDSLRHSINSLPSHKTVIVDAVIGSITGGGRGPNESNGPNDLPGLLGGDRWGGIRSFQTGGIYQETPNGLYRFAERGTKQEALVPQNGNAARSRSIVDVAAGWYGGRVAWPGSATAGGGGPVTIENHIEIGGEVVRVVRTEIRESHRALRSRVTAGAVQR